MLLKDVCTMDVACCGAATTVIEAARLMRHHHVGDLVVVADPEAERIPLGVVTDRDLAIEVLAPGLDPAVTTVGALIRHPVVIATESEDTADVIERMRVQGVRRIPVVDGRGAAVGIVTLDDMLRHLADEIGTLLDIVEIGRRREQRVRR
jgi:CBS domain-containing protein